MRIGVPRRHDAPRILGRRPVALVVREVRQKGASLSSPAGRPAGRLLAAACALSLSATLLAPGPVSAYSGSNAAAWADAHWNSCSSTYPCLDNDCANFVSNALHFGGGYPMNIGTGVETNHTLWFSTFNGLGLYVASDTWAYAKWLEYYLNHDLPGGVILKNVSGTNTAAKSGLKSGDVLFYDWDSNGTADHVAIQTYYGTDPTWPNGSTDRVTEHTTNRKDVRWTLDYWNANRNTTTIHLMQVLATN